MFLGLLCLGVSRPAGQCLRVFSIVLGGLVDFILGQWFNVETDILDLEFLNSFASFNLFAKC